MFIFLIYSLALCWGNVSDSKVTMKFPQVHYFSSQNIGGDKRYYVPTCSKVGQICPPRTLINSVTDPCYKQYGKISQPQGAHTRS